MSYYDDPITLLNAQIASQKSVLTDYMYSYRKVINMITTTSFDTIDLNVFNQAVQLIGTIQGQKGLIAEMENQLNNPLQPVEQQVVVEQPVVVVDLSGNSLQQQEPLVDLSENPLQPPVIEQQPVEQPIVDLSGNPT